MCVRDIFVGFFEVFLLSFFMFSCFLLHAFSLVLIEVFLLVLCVVFDVFRWCFRGVVVGFLCVVEAFSMSFWRFQR